MVRRLWKLNNKHTYMHSYLLFYMNVSTCPVWIHTLGGLQKCWMCLCTFLNSCLWWFGSPLDCELSLLPKVFSLLLIRCHDKRHLHIDQCLMAIVHLSVGAKSRIPEVMIVVFSFLAWTYTLCVSFICGCKSPSIRDEISCNLHIDGQWFNVT